MEPTVSGPRMMRHVRHLSETIGPRLAGSEAEQRGADYIERQMRRIGLQDVHQQHFACKWYEIEHASLQAKFGRQWREVTMDAVAHTPCTPGEIEAELVYIGTGSAMEMEGANLQGKVALVHGTYGPNTHMLERLAAAEVAAVIWTDVRYTADWNILIGLPWTFLPYLTFPAASVPFPVAWELVSQGVKRVRLNLQVTVEDRPSQNVIGTLPGETEEGGVLVCGHHDTVRGVRGAEDNAVGVACALEAAEALIDAPRRRPVTIVSFGTEEQLSQGAYEYVACKRYGADNLDLVLNVDAVGSWTGVNEVFAYGSDSFRGFVEGRLQDLRYPHQTFRDPEAFSDHFPFIVRGVPSLWLTRRNCAGGRWFHHGIYDTMEQLSPDELARCAEVVVTLARDIAARDALPYERAFPPGVRRGIAAVARGWFPQWQAG